MEFATSLSRCRLRAIEIASRSAELMAKGPAIGALPAMWQRFVVALLILFASNAQAQALGFDKSFRVYQGDLAPADGLIDLYIRGTGPIPIAVDDIDFVIPPVVNEFVLKNNGNGTFQLIATLTSAQRSAARAWPSSGIERSLRDVDLNGAVDLTLVDVGDAITGALDQTIFAFPQRGRSPLQITAHDSQFQSFHRDMGQWLLNPGYFDNVPLKLVSAQPATPVWYAASADPSDYGFLFAMIQRCQQRYPNSPCGYTPIDPTPNARDSKGCNRTVDLIDPNTYQIVGTTTADVCEYDMHVYVYLPGSVTLQADDTIFSADAKQAADVLKDFRAGCSSVPDPAAEQLENVLTDVFDGDLWEQQGQGVSNVTNSFPHAPFPNDSAFNPADLTFHHYDVVTEMCDLGTSGCNTPHMENLLLRYSVPTRQLKPFLPQVNYTERLRAYATFVPFGPLSYIRYIGDIKQQYVTPPFGTGAIQNVTQNNHMVFPGTITRLVHQNGPWIDVVTHGIGINRAWCTHYSPKLPVQVIIAWSNDVFGAAAFRALDRQMKKFYDGNPTGLPGSSPSSGSSKPGFGILGQPAGLESPP